MPLPDSETTEATATQLLPPDEGAVVRMYRVGGLGDCFLVAFGRAGRPPCHVLIDCGVFMGTPGGRERMVEIAEDIERVTGGQLDVLVATHEHWDHLSGFQYAEDVFRRLNINEVWLAWTEDPQHPLARTLRAQRHSSLRGLHAAVEQLQTLDSKHASEIRNVLAFSGEEPEAIGKQIALVRSLGDTVRYCQPGQPPLSLPGTSATRAFVLGPPEDQKLIRQSRPRKGDIYARNPDANSVPPAVEASFYAAVEGKATAAGERPFSAAFGASMNQALSDAHYGTFFTEHYGVPHQEQPRWRQIQADWLLTAEDLALKLDNNTNNTSLALAFELGNGQVLLFPGDAQVGNCQSWQQVNWPMLTPPVSGPDLLRRTVLYKVGHHASENATLAAQGLELMESEQLVALIPVDETQAQQKSWHMPYAPLHQRLLAKTHGRVLRADTGLPMRPETVPVRLWEPFAQRISQDPSERKLWVQVVVEGELTNSILSPTKDIQ